MGLTCELKGSDPMVVSLECSLSNEMVKSTKCFVARLEREFWYQLLVDYRFFSILNDLEGVALLLIKNTFKAMGYREKARM